MPLPRQILWLRIGAALVIASGILVLSGAHPATAALLRFCADLLFWPVDGAPGDLTQTTRLLCAIGGGVMLGWGVMIWHIAALLPQAVARRAILSGILLWFVADSLGSILAGAWLNVAGNLVFLALFCAPLFEPNKVNGG